MAPSPEYAPGVPKNVAELTGPLHLGICFNWGLFGILCVQVYLYFINYPTDRRRNKCLVYGLFVFEAAQTALLTRDSFAILGSGWGDLSRLDYLGEMWLSGPFMNGIISATVQSIFAWRIYLLGKSKLLSVFIVAVALMESAAAMAQGLLVDVKFHDRAHNLQRNAFAVTTVWLVGSAICDVVICVSMIYLLKTAQRQTKFRETGDMLTRLLRLSVGTGMLTASVAAVDAILFLVYQQNNYYMAPIAVLGKLYSNSLMVLFNARIRQDGASRDQRPWKSSTYSTPVTRIEFARHSAPVISIEVRTDMSTDGDVSATDETVSDHGEMKLHPDASSVHVSRGSVGSADVHYGLA